MFGQHGFNDRKLTVNKKNSFSSTDEITVTLQTLEGCVTGRFDREVRRNDETGEDGIQKSLLTAIDIFIAWRI